MKKGFYTLLLIASTATLQAQVLQDNFGSYTTGNDLNTQGGWTNNSSNPGGLGNCVGVGCTNQKISATGLSFPNYGTSTKSVAISPERDGCGKGWATNITSGSFYVSFLVNFSDVSCIGTCSQDVDYFRVLDRGSNFTTIVRMFAKKNTGTTIQFGVEKGNNGLAARVYTANQFNLNTTHLLVLKYTLNSGSNADDVVKLYVNPDMSQPEPAVADITTNLGSDNNNGVLNAAAVSFRLNTAGLVPAGNYSLISVGTLWSQLPHTPASARTIDLDFSGVKAFATSPVQAVFQLSSTKTEKLSLEMMDITGRVVLQQTEKIIPGKNSIYLNTSKLAPGIYQVRAFGSKGSTPTVRFVK